MPDLEVLEALRTLRRHNKTKDFVKEILGFVENYDCLLTAKHIIDVKVDKFIRDCEHMYSYSDEFGMQFGIGIQRCRKCQKEISYY